MSETAEPTASSVITEREIAEVDAANAAGTTPIVFVHGLWLLASSWDRWAEYFAAAGYSPVKVGWPDDPASIEEAREHPEAFAGKSVGQVADHAEDVIRRLDRKPVIVGHSFGGLLVQILAGRGLAAATVAISPAPFRGVLPLPYSALKAASGVLANPANTNRAVPLTFDQFRYGFANVVDEEQAQRLYEEFSVAGPGKPLFQAAAANLNPWTEAKVDLDQPDRGPLLYIASPGDHQAPPVIAKASYKKQQRNPAPTEYVEIEGRGHSLTIDDGWEDVARLALDFAAQHAPASAG